MAENGRGGTPIFAPVEPDEPWGGEDRKSRILERWSVPLSEPGWERAWGAWDGDRMVGHLDLRTDKLAACQHRALIGMGVEQTHRRIGLGAKLIQTAMAWAASESNLDWLDLCVFEVNLPAQKLYQKLGFVETGRVRDRFRVSGQSICDISMSFRLRAPA